MALRERNQKFAQDFIDDWKRILGYILDETFYEGSMIKLPYTEMLLGAKDQRAIVKYATRFLKALEKKKCFKVEKDNDHLCFIISNIDKEKLDRILKPFEKYEKSKANIIANSIELKNINLNESGRYIEINNGATIIPFNSKSEKDFKSKEFKIFFHLWDFRWEEKKNKIIRKGDYITKDNLKRGTESKSVGAIDQTIKRLRQIFKKRKLPIVIEPKGGKYRLVIYFT